MHEKTRRIRALNDAFRQSFEGGIVTLTQGVNSLPSDVRAMVLRKVATFAAFNPNNDPYDEHDFGNFELTGRSFFFKIDYYDPKLEFGSDDPSDPKRTSRVLTIMLAEEY